MGRKAYRAKLCVPIHCQVIDPPHHPPRFSATTQDISMTGIHALMPHKLRPGTSLKIEAQLPLDKHRHAFSAMGKVLRAEQSKSPHIKPRLFPTAIRFVSYGKGGTELLGPVVDSHRPHTA